MRGHSITKSLSLPQYLVSEIFPPLNQKDAARARIKGTIFPNSSHRNMMREALSTSNAFSFSIASIETFGTDEV